MAMEVRFLGSPTVRVNGLDIDPTAWERQSYGLTRRRYGASAMPTEEMIARALVETTGRT